MYTLMDVYNGYTEKQKREIARKLQRNADTEEMRQVMFEDMNMNITDVYEGFVREFSELTKRGAI